ncbi:MAG: histidine triad nucleotide-binding protein [Candidatus Yanofskybacteria bacterium]|nr:histidine triad nucleotide-binding protein [Candidatus Yanofskybacteria bacterium]
MISDVFCKIINKELKADVVKENDEFLVIKDIKPAAPVHLLVIPKKHYDSLADFQDSDAEVLGRALLMAEEVAKDAGLEKGYRIIINEGEHGGKLVPHLHVHVLGGKRLGPKIVQ